MTDPLLLPERRGPRPRTTPTNPHAQLDQQPLPAVAGALREALAAAVFALPDVHERAVHPVARLGLIPPTVVMVYAPRDEGERDVVVSLVRAAHAHAHRDLRDASGAGSPPG